MGAYVGISPLRGAFTAHTFASTLDRNIGVGGGAQGGSRLVSISGRGRGTAALLAACGSSGNAGSSGGASTTTSAAGPAGTAAPSNAPGVTPTEIDVGSISTLTGPIASNFEALVPGVQAYFDYINAQGGVNGRKLVLAHNLDDGGNPSQFNQ